LLPHFLHAFAPLAFLALHLRHIQISVKAWSAIGNFPILKTPFY
jgi:hypothetical protein